MTKEDFKKICSEYVGKFKEENGEIVFYNNNHLISYYSDGKVYADKTVYCEIVLQNDGGLSGYEKTYEILGGFGMPPSYLTPELLKRELEKYQFKKTKMKQLSIFDYEEVE